MDTKQRKKRLFSNKKSIICTAVIAIAAVVAIAIFLTPNQATSIGIIGGADGPTSIFVSSNR